MYRLRLDPAEMMAAVVSTILLVTRTVQLFGGVSAIVLTVVTGQWSLFIVALLTVLIGPLALGLGLIPGALVGFVGARLFGGTLRNLGFVLVGVSHLLVLGCATIWTYYIGKLFVFMDGVTDGSLLVHLARVLWAYETTTGVLAFMAAKSGDDELSWPVYTVTSVASLAFLIILAITRSATMALVPLIVLSVFGSLVLTWVVVQRERGVWV